MTTALELTSKYGPAIGPMLRPAAAANYLGMSISSFYQQVAAGDLPPLIKIGPRAAACPKGWLDVAIAQRLAKTIAAA